MLRLSKLGDYGVVLVSHLGSKIDGNLPSLSAHALAEKSALPLSTTSKVLKILHNSKILESSRGASGGYKLAREAKEISLLEIICAVEGPFIMTDCVLENETNCKIKHACPSQRPWQKINKILSDKLSDISLCDFLSL